MLAIDPMGNDIQFIFYAIAVVVFALAAVGVALHEKVSNLVALGLLAVTIPPFWDRLAGL